MNEWESIRAINTYRLLVINEKLSIYLSYLSLTLFAMKKFFVDADVSRARTISTEVYKSAAFFEMAKEKIFAQCWQFLGDTDMVAGNGSCYPFTLLEKYIDEPLLLTRDEGGTLHCLSNVCTHRGNLLISEPCSTSNLRCKYHGRER